MRLLASLAVLLVAVLHAGFLVLEMYLWQTPTGLQVFGMTAQEAATTATLAANQGLYNGFLAAGLIWGLIAGKRDVMAFFLACVVVAGAYGAYSVSMTILYVQAAPAVVALVLLMLSGRRA